MIVSITLILGAMLAPIAPPADTTHCVPATHYLRETLHMQAIIERDTFDDWRTHKRVPGCRITAAGATDIGVRAQAVRFYELLRAAKWTRTPEPADSPNEGSLRFRWEQSDCLFNINAQALLNTDAELKVNERLALKRDETPYQVYVMCMPAMSAGS
jgi:hypothetical protein